MKRAEVSPRVWGALLAMRKDSGPAPDQRGWSDAETAALALYRPIARRGGAAPFLFGQVGQSLDGRVATVTGDARDISGREGLCHLHRCRALADAVVVGVRTALLDDPRLTVRLVDGPDPARVVIDPKGRLPDTAAALADTGARRIVIQSCGRKRPRGIEVIELAARDGWIVPAEIAAALAGCGLHRVLLEGGGVTLARFLDAGLLARLHVAIAPLIIGAGPAGLSTEPIARLADALRPDMHVYGLETDVVFDCDFIGGKASTSTCPTTQVAEPLAACRA